MIIFFLITLLVVIYNFIPQVQIKLVYKFFELTSGLSTKKVKVNGYSIPYSEGGRGPHLIMLHGFDDSRYSFSQTSKYLIDNFHVIIPTLPGFEDTEHDEKRDYSINGQVEFLNEFVHKINLHSFYIVANSMGGHIAAAYAVKYPKMVKTMVLLNPDGASDSNEVLYPIKQKPLMNIQDFDDFSSKVFYHKPWIPNSFKKLSVKKSQKNFQWLNKIRDQLNKGKFNILNDVLPYIKQKTFVIWGDKDSIIPLSRSKIWQNKLCNGEVKIWENMGHAPQYENPKRTALYIRRKLLRNK